MRVGNRQSVIEGLASGRMDLAIMGRPPRIPAVDAEILAPHPHLLIAAAGHRLAGMAQVPVAELLSETFILREEGSGTRILATRWLDQTGKGYPFDTVEMDSNETIKQAVMAGMGIALLSQHTVLQELADGRLVGLKVPGLPIMRNGSSSTAPATCCHPPNASCTTRSWDCAGCWRRDVGAATGGGYFVRISLPARVMRRV